MINLSTSPPYEGKSFNSNTLTVVRQEAQRAVSNPQFQWLIFTCKLNHEVLVCQITLSFCLVHKTATCYKLQSTESIPARNRKSSVDSKQLWDTANVTKEFSIL
jgi:hypothetical protein